MTIEVQVVKTRTTVVEERYVRFYETPCDSLEDAVAHAVANPHDFTDELEDFGYGRENDDEGNVSETVDWSSAKRSDLEQP